MAFTYFFRDLQTLNTAVRYLVPFSSGAAKVRVWDAGCAMGQEPYSLAILLAEAMNHFAYRKGDSILLDIGKQAHFEFECQNINFRQSLVQAFSQNFLNKQTAYRHIDRADYNQPVIFATMNGLEAWRKVSVIGTQYQVQKVLFLLSLLRFLLLLPQVGVYANIMLTFIFSQIKDF